MENMGNFRKMLLTKRSIKNSGLSDSERTWNVLTICRIRKTR